VVPSEHGRWDLFYEQFTAAVRGSGTIPVDPLGRRGPRWPCWTPLAQRRAGHQHRGADFSV